MMLTCLLLLLPENSMQTILYKQYYFYPKAIWRARTFIKIHYAQGKQIKQVNSCFDYQTFYDNLWHFIYFYSHLGQFYNFSKFYDILWFYDRVWELCIFKRRTFWKNTHQMSFFQEFSTSFSFFQVFFQESSYIPGVSRSSGHPVRWHIAAMSLLVIQMWCLANVVASCNSFSFIDG